MYSSFQCCCTLNSTPRCKHSLPVRRRPSIHVTPLLWYSPYCRCLKHKSSAICPQYYEDVSTAKLGSVAQSCLTLCDPMDCSTPGFPVHHQLPSNSGPLSRWCHPIISPSVIPFSSHLQSFPESGSFPMSPLFASCGQVLEFQLQHQSFQWIFRTDFL